MPRQRRKRIAQGTAYLVRLNYGLLTIPKNAGALWICRHRTNYLINEVFSKQNHSAYILKFCIYAAISLIQKVTFRFQDYIKDIWGCDLC